MLPLTGCLGYPADQILSVIRQIVRWKERPTQRTSGVICVSAGPRSAAAGEPLKVRRSPLDRLLWVDSGPIYLPAILDFDDDPRFHRVAIRAENDLPGDDFEVRPCQGCLDGRAIG